MHRSLEAWMLQAGLWPLAFLIALAWVLGVLASAVLYAWQSLESPLGVCVHCGKRWPWWYFLPGGRLCVSLGLRKWPCQHALWTWNGAWGGGYVLLGLVLAWLYREGDILVFLQVLVLVYALVLLSWMDLLSLEVDLWLIFGVLFLRLVSVAFLWPQMMFSAFAGALMSCGLLFLVSLVYEMFRGKPGFGSGDMALMAMIGSFVGWQGMLPTLGISALLGLILAPLWFFRKKSPLATPLPYGPCLALAGLGVYLVQTLFPLKSWLFIPWG